VRRGGDGRSQVRKHAAFSARAARHDGERERKERRGWGRGEVRVTRGREHRMDNGDGCVERATGRLVQTVLQQEITGRDRFYGTTKSRVAAISTAACRWDGHVCPARVAAREKVCVAPPNLS
jgi:hypothetical protein